MRDLIIDVMLGLITTVLIPALPWLFSKLASFLNAHIKEKWAQALAEKGTQIAKEVVLAMMQTAVAEAKRAKNPGSPGDASITKEEGKEIFKKAMQAAGAALGPAFVKDADKVLGEGAVANSLAQKIEAAILMAKAQGLDQVAAPKVEPPAVAAKEDAAPVPLSGSTPGSSSGT